MGKIIPIARKLGHKKRDRLFKHLFLQFDGKCHWCKCEVVRGLQCGKDTAPNCATIDHLMTMREGRTLYMEGGHVLSCYLCNQVRNVIENIKYGAKVDIMLPLEQPLDWCLQPISDYTGRPVAHSAV
jgi:hypothetical protein